MGISRHVSVPAFLSSLVCRDVIATMTAGDKKARFDVHVSVEKDEQDNFLPTRKLAPQLQLFVSQGN